MKRLLAALLLVAAPAVAQDTTWTGKYNGVDIDEGKYNGVTITAAKYNGVDIVTTTTANTVTFTGVTLFVGSTSIAPNATSNYEFPDNSGYTIVDSLKASGVSGDVFLRWFRLVSGATVSQIRFSASDTDSGSAAGPDLSDAWMEGASSITVSRGAASVTIPGPNNVGNSTQDSADPYVWLPSTSTRTLIAAFITAVGSGTHNDFTITLSDE